MQRKAKMRMIRAAGICLTAIALRAIVGVAPCSAATLLSDDFTGRDGQPIQNRAVRGGTLTGKTYSAPIYGLFFGSGYITSNVSENRDTRMIVSLSHAEIQTGGQLVTFTVDAEPLAAVPTGANQQTDIFVGLGPDDVPDTAGNLSLRLYVDANGDNAYRLRYRDADNTIHDLLTGALTGKGTAAHSYSFTLDITSDKVTDVSVDHATVGGGYDLGTFATPFDPTAIAYLSFYTAKATVDSNGKHLIDGFTVTAVPEPGTLGLLGIGGLILARRRRGSGEASKFGN